LQKVENYKLEKRNVNGIQLFVTSYKIGPKFYCHIENADPGATIARAYGDSQEEAEQAALAKVRVRL
jgi:hypothetical protein